MIRFAEYIGKDPEDLKGTPFETDVLDIVLQECSELLDPRTGDRLTPVDLTRETDHVDMSAPDLVERPRSSSSTMRHAVAPASAEPVTKNHRIPDWIRKLQNQER